MKRKIAAILAADIVAYSRLIAQDEEETLARLASYRQVFEDFVTRFGGRVFNTAGDSVLAEFPSSVEATRCAIDIQESIRTRNLGYPASRQMLFRIGLTIGDVVEREGDLLGDGVNIAARLEGLAEPGGICVSQSVFEQVANKLSVPFRDLGQQSVKNIPQPVRAFMIQMPGEAGDRGRTGRPSVLDAQNTSAGKALWAVAAAIIVLLAGAGGLAWHFRDILIRKPADQPKIAAIDTGPTKAQSQSKATPISQPGADKASAEPKTQSGKGPEADQSPTSASPSRNTPPDGAKTSADAGATQPEGALGQDGTAVQNGAMRQASLPVQPPPALPSGPKPPAQGRPQIPDGATAAEIFALLSKSGGIVKDASTPPELYHNARLWEQRGQAAEARRAYGKLAALGTEAIDAHMRYAAIMRAQDGRAGAREVYAVLAGGKGGRAAALVHAMQFSGAERRKRVAAFAAQHNDFAPAHMLLAREFSADRLGSQTLGDKQRQFAALTAFLKAEDAGTLPKYFMDHSVLTEWVDEARKRHALLEKFFKTAVLKPVASFMRSNQGWHVNLSLPEAATSISYRIGEGGAFKSTGTFPHIDQRTGRPMPNSSFELPPNAGASTLHIRYRDANEIEQGPYAVKFDPLGALIESQKSILERFSNNWVVFGGEQVQRSLLYFTHLASYRCAIKRATIGFADGPLDRELPLPSCNMRDPHAIPRDMTPYLTVPRSLESVRLQLTYADGTQSEIKTFARNH